MMVLVDTSVWIRFLLNRGGYGKELQELLAAGRVTGHELVYGELLIGDKGGRSRLLADYRRMRQARRVAGWIDIHLLASALAEGYALWTADPRLAALAEELGCGYRAGL